MMSSITLGDSSGLQGVRDLFARFFTAEAWSGKNFRGIRKVQRIECTAHPLHRVEVWLCEHFRHHQFFFLTDAVLAGDGAAGFQTKFQDAVGKLFGGLLLACDAAIVKNQWM